MNKFVITCYHPWQLSRIRAAQFSSQCSEWKSFSSIICAHVQLPDESSITIRWKILGFNWNYVYIELIADETCSYDFYTTNTYYFGIIKRTVPKLESTNQRKAGNVEPHMRSHFDPLSFRSKKETWLQIITLDLLMVARNMGMYNHMSMLKYNLQFRSTVPWNFQFLVISYSKGNNKVLRRVCMSVSWKCKPAVRHLGLLCTYCVFLLLL